MPGSGEAQSRCICDPPAGFPLGSLPRKLRFQGRTRMRVLDPCPPPPYVASVCLRPHLELELPSRAGKFGGTRP